MKRRESKSCKNKKAKQRPTHNTDMNYIHNLPPPHQFILSRAFMTSYYYYIYIYMLLSFPFYESFLKCPKVYQNIKHIKRVKIFNRDLFGMMLHVA